MNVDQVRQGKAGLQPHGPVGVIERLEEGRLQLRQERLQHGAGFGEKDGESVQDRGLDVVGEPVSQDPDQGSGDVND